jgi:hypothetical protein
MKTENLKDESLVAYYSNRVDQLQAELQALKLQVNYDWMIALEFKTSAHRLVLETVSDYKKYGHSFYMERLEKMRENFQSLKGVEDSAINRFRLYHIADIDEALQKMKEEDAE